VGCGLTEAVTPEQLCHRELWPAFGRAGQDTTQHVCTFSPALCVGSPWKDLASPPIQQRYAIAITAAARFTLDSNPPR